MAKNERYSKLLPYHIIVAASSGDVNAINMVLKHYERYIAVLATRRHYDESGNVHYCVDETVTDLMNCHGFAYMNCHQIDLFSVISQPHRAAA